MQFITHSISLRSGGTALLALFLLIGCATTGVDLEAVRQKLESRNLLQVDVGPEVALSSVGFERLESIVDGTGAAHLAGIDVKGEIHHIVVGSTGESHDEVIGALPQTVERDKAALDIVEYPAGTIRIAAGDTEYARQIAGGEWSHTGGNPCRQYLVHMSSLFCAFVASGEEVGTAPRTDRTVGLIFILPIYWQNTVRPGKLVLAERVDASWVVRTVIDSATNLSTDEADFAIGVDRQDMVHVVFIAWRGGSTFFVGGGGYGGGGAGSGPEFTVNYARFPFPAAGLKAGARAEWQEVQSEGGIGQARNSASWVKMLGSRISDINIENDLYPPYLRHVAVAPNSGVALALNRSYFGAGRERWGVGTTVIPLGNSYELLAVNGFPVGVEYDDVADMLFRIGIDDVQHFLLPSCHGGFYRECESLVYERRAEDGKLATMVLANTKLGIGSRSMLGMGTTNLGGATLAIGSRGMVFAAWTVAGKGLVGRWISPRPPAIGARP
jgi:hypothetical protein